MKYVLQVLLLLVASLEGYSVAGSIFHPDSDGYVGEAPQNYEAHPNGFWFGTQDLLCVWGKQAEDLIGRLPDIISSRLSDRNKRNAPRRPTFEAVHSLVFYKGHVYEWGVGRNGYHMGRQTVTRDCPVTWETSAAGYSNCPAHLARDYIMNYEDNFGVYNLVTNNCHKFSNRLSELLSSNTCEHHSEAPRNRWADLARDTWRQISRGRFNIRDIFRKDKSQSEDADVPTVE